VSAWRDTTIPSSTNVPIRIRYIPRFCLDASLLAEIFSYLPPAGEGQHEGLRHI
jgi:hypothetical protein